MEFYKMSDSDINLLSHSSGSWEFEIRLAAVLKAAREESSPGLSSCLGDGCFLPLFAHHLPFIPSQRNAFVLTILVCFSSTIPWILYPWNFYESGEIVYFLHSFLSQSRSVPSMEKGSKEWISKYLQWIESSNGNSLVFWQLLDIELDMLTFVFSKWVGGKESPVNAGDIGD